LPNGIIAIGGFNPFGQMWPTPPAGACLQLTRARCLQRLTEVSINHVNSRDTNFGRLGVRLRLERQQLRRRRVDVTKLLEMIRSQKGATAIEYGLIAALIAVAAIAAMQSVGNKLNTTFNNVSNNLG
jgi:pilus assembly protein Flp/PilA